MSIPTSLDEMDAAWLSSCLAATWPGVEVSEVRHLTVLHGSATKVRMAVDYVAGTRAGPPASVWAKIGLESHSAYIGSVVEVYRNEDTVYSEALPLYELRRPEVVYRELQEDPLRSVLVLEDLLAREVRFPAPPEPLSLDRVRRGLAELARLHAQSWMDGRLVARGIDRVMAGPRGGLYQSITDAAPDLFRSLRAFAAPVALHDAERFAAGMRAYQELAWADTWCLVHGDAHMNNIYLESTDRVGFLDWQLAGRGHWVHDVAYFVVSALDIPDRRRHERELLTGYLASISGHGIDAPGFEDAWHDYRRAVFFSFSQWLANWDSTQLAEYNMAAFARAAAAMVDLDTYGAMGL